MGSATFNRDISHCIATILLMVYLITMLWKCILLTAMKMCFIFVSATYKQGFQPLLAESWLLNPTILKPLWNYQWNTLICKSRAVDNRGAVKFVVGCDWPTPNDVDQWQASSCRPASFISCRTVNVKVRPAQYFYRCRPFILAGNSSRIASHI